MKNPSELLKLYLSEQIALEEHLCSVIETQLSDISELDFADAKKLLQKTQTALERHYAPLNELLDKLDSDALKARTKVVASNGEAMKSPLNFKEQRIKTSRMLRDDYSALNLITISNARLHTTALALNSLDIAATALKHLENLAPYVLKMEEMVPDVVTRELRSQSPEIDLAIAKQALDNTKGVWRRVI